MSYCTGKNIEKSRGKAVKMLVIEKKPVEVVANCFGVHRSTIWRWHQRWPVQNSHIELENPIRRKYLGISAYKYELCKWNISSLSTVPKNPHTLSDDLIQLALDVRGQLKRRAKVIWHHINFTLCIKIGPSSVRRISKRYDRTKKLKKSQIRSI